MQIQRVAVHEHTRAPHYWTGALALPAAILASRLGFFVCMSEPLTIDGHHTKIRIVAQENEWSVVFYIEKDGESPVEAFLRALDQKTYGRFLWSIDPQDRMEDFLRRVKGGEHPS